MVRGTYLPWRWQQPGQNVINLRKYIGPSQADAEIDHAE
jgi:hypothetical protein